jgi:hypothetical protein
MSSRLGSLLYAAALVVVLGAGCAVPRAVPTVLTTPTVSVSVSVPEGITSPGIPTGSTLTAQPTSAAASPSVPRTTTARSTAVVSSSPTRATTSAAQGCGLPAALLGKDLALVPGSAKVVALTFDAGANADGGDLRQGPVRTTTSGDGSGNCVLLVIRP